MHDISTTVEIEQGVLMLNRTNNLLLDTLRKFPGPYALAAIMLGLHVLIAVQGRLPVMLWAERLSFIHETHIGYWHYSLLVFAWVIIAVRPNELMGLILAAPLHIFLGMLIGNAGNTPSASASVFLFCLLCLYAAILVGMAIRQYALQVTDANAELQQLIINLKQELETSKNAAAASH